MCKPIKNKNCKCRKLLYLCIIVFAVITFSLVILSITLPNQQVVQVLTVLSTIFNILLSLVALLYSIFSGKKVECKINEIYKMGKELQEERVKINTFRESLIAENKFTDEYKEKLLQFEKDLDCIDQFFE